MEQLEQRLKILLELKKFDNSSEEVDIHEVEKLSWKFNEKDSAFKNLRKERDDIDFAA